MSNSEDPNNRIYCIQQTEPHKQVPLVLKGKEVVIGRNPQATVIIRSSNVSRVHAILTKTDNTWSIRDAKSMNGVWVNNEQLDPFLSRELVPGDVFSLGPPQDSEFIYKFFLQTVRDSSESSPPCKMIKKDLEQAKMKAELDERLECLQRQLDEKLEAEKKLQNQLQAQQKEMQDALLQERERIKEEKKEAEARLKQELEDRLAAEEQALRVSLQSQKEALLAEKERVEQELRQQLNKEMQDSLRKEQDRLNKELEQSSMKATLLEQQLVETKNSQDKSKEDMLHRFGDLMETELTCSICSELFVQAYTLGCSHTYCRHCIAKWKKKKKDCPICRTKIKSEAHALVIDNFIERMVDNLSPDMKARRLQLLKERGAPTARLADQVLNQSINLPSTSVIQSNLVPVHANAVPVTTPAGSQSTVLLRPITAADLPPELQRLFGGLNGPTNAVRFLIGPQQQLHVVSNGPPGVNAPRPGQTLIRVPCPRSTNQVRAGPAPPVVTSRGDIRMYTRAQTQIAPNVNTGRVPIMQTASFAHVRPNVNTGRVGVTHLVARGRANVCMTVIQPPARVPPPVVGTRPHYMYAPGSYR